MLKKEGEIKKSFWIRRIKILLERLNIYEGSNYNIDQIEEEVSERDIDYCISLYTHYQKIYNSSIDKIREERVHENER